MIKGIHHVSMRADSDDAYERAKQFYLDILGLTVKREWPEGIMLDTGAGLIEIFRSGGGARICGAVRHFALASDDVDTLARKSIFALTPAGSRRRASRSSSHPRTSRSPPTRPVPPGSRSAGGRSARRSSSSASARASFATITVEKSIYKWPILWYTG